MAKYIDAEKLRKEVKRLEKAAHKSAIGCADSETRKFHEGKDYAYQHVGILIDSFQQDKAAVELEQCPPVLSEFMEKASEIGKKYNYGFGPNLSQPKVNLEKEIETFTTRLYNDTFGNGQGTLDEFDWEDIAMVIEETAHYFYELSINTKQ